MTTQFQKLTDTIENSYRKNIGQLDLIHQRHFLYRLYLSKKTEDLQRLLAGVAHRTNPVGLLLVDEFSHQFSIGVEKQLKQTSTLTASYPHEQERFKIWRNHPEVIYFYTVLRECFYLKYFNVTFQLDKKRVSSLLQKTLDASDFIQNSSTHALCIIFYLEYLGMLPTLHGQGKWEFVEIVKQQFLPDSIANDTQLFNYLYAINHIIICDTFFYLRPPNKKLVTYVVELEKYIDRHYNDISLDLKAESLLSCELLGAHTVNFKQKVINEIIENFNESLEIIDNKKTELPTYQSCEHTNAVSILIARIDTITTW